MFRRRWRRSEMAEYKQATRSLYRAVHEHTGCRVIVDSSKSAIHAELLESIPEIDLYMVHLVRDPRATAYSWLRMKKLPDFGDDRLMSRQRPLTSARRWMKWQVVIERWWSKRRKRYMLLRYEDFIAAPAATLQRILLLVGEAPSSLPLSGESTVHLTKTHSVSGNPNRFKVGEVRLRDDAEWVRKMKSTDRLVVTAVTLPLLKRYGYLGARRLDGAPDEQKVY